MKRYAVSSHTKNGLSMVRSLSNTGGLYFTLLYFSRISPPSRLTFLSIVSTSRYSEVMEDWLVTPRSSRSLQHIGDEGAIAIPSGPDYLRKTSFLGRRYNKKKRNNDKKIKRYCAYHPFLLCFPAATSSPPAELRQSPSLDHSSSFDQSDRKEIRRRVYKERAPTIECS